MTAKPVRNAGFCCLGLLLFVLGLYLGSIAFVNVYPYAFCIGSAEDDGPSHPDALSSNIQLSCRRPRLPTEEDRAMRQGYLTYMRERFAYTKDLTPKGAPHLAGAPVRDFPVVIPDAWKTKAAGAFGALYEVSAISSFNAAAEFVAAKIVLSRAVMSFVNNVVPDAAISFLVRRSFPAPPKLDPATGNSTAGSPRTSIDHVQLLRTEDEQMADHIADSAHKALRKQVKTQVQQSVALAPLKDSDMPEEGHLFYSLKELKDSMFGLFKNPLPPSAHDFSADETFAWYRLAGPNPGVLEPCTKAMRKSLAGLKQKEHAELRRRIDAAMEAKTLYCVSHAAFAGVKASAWVAGDEHHNATIPKFVAPAIALFEVTSGQLMPVAIQLDVPRLFRKAPPIFTPVDRTVYPRDFSWEIAKAAFTSSDGAYHQGVAHLGQIHLIVQAFVPATYRHLHPDHPLHRLLEVHLIGTTFINYFASNHLMAPGSVVDDLISLDIHQASDFIAAKVKEMLAEDFSFPALLKKRRMRNVPGEYPYPYPYRDDATAYWEAIYRWVEDYLGAFYSGTPEEKEQRIAADNELQAWAKELSAKKGGDVGWIRKNWGKKGTNHFELLCSVISEVIFKASVEHAAVNFPQKPIMSFSPAYTLGLWAPLPTDTSPKTEEEYMRFLGPRGIISLQAQTGNLLGSVFYSQLGNYDRRLFHDSSVDGPLKRFQQDIKAIARNINARNSKGRSYDTLLPASIPQSINI